MEAKNGWIEQNTGDCIVLGTGVGEG